MRKILLTISATFAVLSASAAVHVIPEPVSVDASWLEERNFLGRGIDGQTTMQLLVRFRADVIELDPEYVVILAGINDIARNNIEKAS